MRINIFFNQPPGRNSTQVSFVLPSVQDKKYNFQVGIIKRGRIHYSKGGWVGCNQLTKFKFTARRGEQVIVERKNKKTNKVSSSIWDISQKWPAKATGPTMVNVPWDF